MSEWIRWGITTAIALIGGAAAAIAVAIRWERGLGAKVDRTLYDAGMRDTANALQMSHHEIMECIREINAEAKARSEYMHSIKHELKNDLHNVSTGIHAQLAELSTDVAVLSSKIEK